jgi:hypothetical protein
MSLVRSVFATIVRFFCYDVADKVSGEVPGEICVFRG